MDWFAVNDSACSWFNSQYGLARTLGDAAKERAVNGTDADIRLHDRDKPLNPPASPEYGKCPTCGGRGSINIGKDVYVGSVCPTCHGGGQIRIN
jgi:hypothetical protein